MTFEVKFKGTLGRESLPTSVLDKDPLTISVDDVLNIKVDLTLVGGKVVHDRLGT